MAATRQIYLGVLLLLAVAASTTSGAAAFGLPRGLRPGHCASVFRTYDTVSPFMTGNTTAIHLGNTKSCVAGYGGRLDPHTAYQFCIPSWVVFTDNGTLVGEAAMNHAAVRPGTAVSGFKRLLGIRMYNEMVKREAELVPYHFTEQLGRCGIEMEIEEGNLKRFLPEDVASILVAELKRMAEAHLGREIRYAVVTVPGHFNGVQRSSLVMEAAQWRGGFRTAKLVDEQVAAAAGYRLHEKRGDRKVILVFHLGGRTCHATKFRFKDGSGHLLDEHHDAYLGGDDFTGRVVDYFVELIEEKHHRDIRGDEGTLRKLRAECERAKKLLSDREGVLMNIGSVLGEGADIYEELTRAKFEELNRDLMERGMEIVETVVMEGAPTSQMQSRKDAIDEVILVGGSVRIPMVGQLLEDYFNGRGLIRDEDAVIRGAALLSRPESARYVEECYYGGVSGPLWLAK
ncbi:heat shock 70 kDa protein BIP2-like [Aegilops tauschii subsp. strangulata]|uniref:Luminal-binding protein 2 n=2 Tax=Aegilops tauschii subsp. strangulata TaxID=200361 RepID=A0A453J5C8_AEGTS|nr:heat shock 70 kDa protein BIP2-like [Aegilops tauschii subsp. strangulata]